MTSYSTPIDSYLDFIRFDGYSFPARRKSSRVRSPTSFTFYISSPEYHCTVGMPTTAPSSETESQMDDEKSDDDDDVESSFRAGSLIDIDEISDFKTTYGSVAGYDGCSEGEVPDSSNLEDEPELETVEVGAKRRKITTCPRMTTGCRPPKASASITSRANKTATANTITKQMSETVVSEKVVTLAEKELYAGMDVENDVDAPIAPTVKAKNTIIKECMDEKPSQEEFEFENEHSDDVYVDDCVRWTTYVSWNI